MSDVYQGSLRELLEEMIRTEIDLHSLFISLTTTAPPPAPYEAWSTPLVWQSSTPAPVHDPMNDEVL